MALDSHGNWTPILPDGPPFEPCGYGEVRFCSGIPDAATGNDGDVGVDTVNATAYIKISGVWVLISGGGGGGSANMSGVGSPVGVVTPNAVNVWYRDTATDNYWWATGATNADWTPVA